MQICNWPGCTAQITGRGKTGRCFKHAFEHLKVPTEEKRKHKAESARQWRKRHPEKIQEYNRKHYQANRAKLKQRQRTYYQANKKKILARDHAYYLKNKEKIAKQKHAYYLAHKEKKAEYYRQYHIKHRQKLRACWRAYYWANRDRILKRKHKYQQKHRAVINKRNRQYHRANKKKVRALTRAWQQAHPEKLKEYSRRRRARKVNAEGEHFTELEFQILCAKYGYICLRCGCPHSEEFPLEPDHVIPLSQGGGDSIENIQPLCRSCNQRKNRNIIDWRCEL